MIDHQDTTPIPVDPAPFKPGVRRVLIFGGTFDPPTRAHIELPRLVLERTQADQLVFVPAGRSPHKRENPTASDQHRLAMLRAAVAEAGMHDIAGISTAEITSDYPTAAATNSKHARPATYMIDTLRGFRAALPPGTIMRLLMGADQALAFHRWRDPRVIIAIAEPLVMLRRPAESTDKLLEALREHWPKDECEAWRHRIIEFDVRDISSTDVRELLRRADQTPATRKTLQTLLPPAVLRYIEEHALYREASPG